MNLLTILADVSITVSTTPVKKNTDHHESQLQAVLNTENLKKNGEFEHLLFSNVK